MGKEAQKGRLKMATVEVATSKVLVLSDRPQVMDYMPAAVTETRVSSVEDLEQAIVETGNPVIVIDEKAYRGCDLAALVLDLSEFDNDRVGGIVILVSGGYDKSLLPDLKLAGANRFIKTIDCHSRLEQIVGEAHLDRLFMREARQKNPGF